MLWIERGIGDYVVDMVVELVGSVSLYGDCVVGEVVV